MMGPGIALMTAGGITAAAAISRGEWPSSRVFLGAAVAGGILIGIGQVSPPVASRFATLILVTAILTSGVDVARGVTRLIGESPE